MSGGNGAERAAAPLPAEASTEIRRAVGRLITGAHELTVIALVMPVFLIGLELAAEGFSAGGYVERTAEQRPLDRALFVIYAVALWALAVRARLGASRARKLLPDLLSDDGGARGRARARLVRLGGAPVLRRAAEWIATRGCVILILFAIAMVVAWMLLPVPNPLWVTIFGGTAVAIDVRWRALVADAADQLPPT